MASEAMHSGGPSDPGPGGSAGSAGTPHSPPAISYSPSKREPIAVRSARINHCVLGVNSSLRSQQSLMPTNTPSSVTPEGPDNATQAKNLINRDSLLDALFVLYEELNNDSMRKDRNVLQFLEKFRGPMMDLRALRVSISDFEVKKIIGRGHFGEVKVVKEKATGEVFAMKTLRKCDTLSQQAVAFYEEERDIMADAQDTKWITQLHYAFQDTDNLYLVMEFLPGGDLLSLLDRNDNILSEEHAKFYLAELVQAIHTLHSMGYVHRDIKPDNILIDRSGHIKLADFGSAARLSSKKDVTSKMPVGTPDYIAPEVLQAMNERGPSKGQTYGTCCDWWSLGIVAYEMLYGQTPFSDERVMKTYSNIMNFKKTLVFPAEFVVSPQAIALITALLEQADKRLDYKGLIEHKFFEGTFWTNIRQLVPPFVPQLTGLDDTSNFDDFEDDSRASNQRAYLRSLAKKTFETANLPFVGFTHTTQAGQHSMHDSSLVAPVGHQAALAAATGTLSRKDESRRKELQEKLALAQAMENQLRDANEGLKTRLKESEARTAKFESELGTLERQIIEKDAKLKKLEEQCQHETALRKRSEQKAVEIVKGYQRQYKRSDELIKWSLTAPDSPLSERNQSRLLHELPQQILSQQEIIEQLTSELQKTRTIARDYKDKFHSIVSDSEKCVERLQEIQSGNLAYVEGLKKDLSEAVNQRRVVENNLANAKQLCEEYVGRLKELQDSNRELKIKVKTLEVRVSELETELRSSVVNDGTSQLENGEDLCETHSASQQLVIECGQLRAKLQKAQETNARLEMQVVELTCQVVQLQDPRPTEELDEKKLQQPCSTCSSLELQLAAFKRQLEEQRQSAVSTSEQSKGDEKMTAGGERDDVEPRRSVRFSDLADYTINLDNATEDPCALDANRNSVSAVVLTDDEKKQRLSMVSSRASTNNSFHTVASCICNCVEENKLLRQQLSQAKEDQEINKRRWLDTSVDLRKRNEELKELQLDLRIATREAKALKGAADQSEQLRQQVEELRCLLDERVRAEETLKTQLNEAREAATVAADSAAQDALAADSERARLEERLRVLTDTTSTQNDLKEQLATVSDQIGQLTLRCKMLEKDAEMANRRKEDALKQLEQTRKSLKQEQMQNENWKREFSSLGDLMNGLNDEAEQNKTEIVSLRDQVSKLRREKASLEPLPELVESLRAEMAERESVSMDMRDSLQGALRESEEAHRREAAQREQLAQQLTLVQAELKVKARSINSLEDEIVTLKRETTKYITTINNLNRNMVQLNEQLEDVNIRVQDQDECHRSLLAEMDRKTMEHQLVVVRITGQLQQYAKVVDLLKEQLEKASAKKTGGLFGFVGKNREDKAGSGKDGNVGSNQQQSKIRKLQHDLDESRQEVMMLRERLTIEEEKNKAYRARRGTRDNNTNSFQESASFGSTVSGSGSAGSSVLAPFPQSHGLDSASSSLSDCSQNDTNTNSGPHGGHSGSPSSSNSVNLCSPNQLRAAEELAKSPMSNQALMMAAVPTGAVSRATEGVPTNRVSHNIPHKFSHSLAYTNRKCDLCSRSLTVGTKVAVCQECEHSFHVTCSQKAPPVCGLPRELLREYEVVKAVRFAGDVKNASFNPEHPEGYVKIPKNGCPKLGWEKAYLVLDDGVLYIFDKSFIPGGDQIEAIDNKTYSRYNLVGDGQTHMYLDRDVLRSELREGVNTELVLKLVVRSRDQEPRRPLYMLFQGVADKRLWHDVIQNTIERFSKGSKSITRRIADLADNYGPMYCIWEVDSDGDLLLAGGADGLMVVDGRARTLRRAVAGVPPVFQIHLVEIFNIAVMIVDSRKRGLVWCRVSDLRDWMHCEGDVDLPPVNLLRVRAGLATAACRQDAKGHHDSRVGTNRHSAVGKTSNSLAQHGSIENCSVFKVSKDGCVLVVSTTEALVVLRYQTETLQYDVERRLETENLCSSIQITPSNVLFSSDKIYALNLRNHQVREFLDVTDESLALFANFKGPYYILEVEPHTEYVIACKEMGFFVNAAGRRSRPGDISINGSILSLEICQRSLFLCDDDHIQVCMVTPAGQHNDLRLVETLHARGIRLLGRARAGDAIYVSWTWKNIRCISKIFAFPVDNSSSSSDLSAGASAEFSFTSSLEENLERYDCDNLQDNL
ncbi:citron Rho-interacting kinase-like isoform X1 [Varroa jacobsoni]|uniref:citron Rho-interacting kinase-like isoform X1 n=1 Tax=Varroa jacobsoni TaxID=62625 RepID=UPI000BFA8A7E|nr:citron Rho-interacting kinase-like isoform X1 [Varroa jacobsoni]XP_022690224.1 citron Rho-interacting kinase-like isoform X1 [Varroa jacobsoni]